MKVQLPNPFRRQQRSEKKKRSWRFFALLAGALAGVVIWGRRRMRPEYAGAPAGDVASWRQELAGDTRGAERVPTQPETPFTTPEPDISSLQTTVAPPEPPPAPQPPSPAVAAAMPEEPEPPETTAEWVAELRSDTDTDETSTDATAVESETTAQQYDQTVSESPASDAFSADMPPADASPADAQTAEPAQLSEVASSVDSDAPEPADSEVPTPSEQQTTPPTEGAGWIKAGENGSCPDDYPIKGNASSRIYHRPGEPSYEATIPEICFASEEAATALGYRARKR